MLGSATASALILSVWLPAAPPVASPPPPAGPRAAPRCAPARCAPCSARSRRELTLRLAFAMGGFYSRTTHWIRTDAAVRLALGIRVHPVVEVQVAVLSSVERFAATLRAGALWYPWKRGPYVKGGVDVIMAGAGAQPGLATGVGFAWWFRIPLGLYVELEVSGRLTEPRVLELNGVGGLFVYF